MHGRLRRRTLLLEMKCGPLNEVIINQHILVIAELSLKNNKLDPLSYDHGPLKFFSHAVKAFPKSQYNKFNAIFSSGESYEESLSIYSDIGKICYLKKNKDGYNMYPKL